MSKLRTVLGTFALLCLAPFASAQSTYSVIDLGLFDSLDETRTSINNLDQVSGVMDVLIGPDWGGPRATLYNATDNSTHDLGILTVNPACSSAEGLNDLGQVVGWSDSVPIQVDEDGSTHRTVHAFLWDATSGMKDLGVLPGGASSEGIAINNAGQVLGIGRYPSLRIYSFLWDSVNGMQDLSARLGARVTAYDLNEAGNVVGAFDAGLSSTGGVITHAFFWDGSGSLIDIGAVGQSWNNWAAAINNHGQVIGNSDEGAFYWDADHGMRLLGAPNGYYPSDTFLYAMNDSGTIVGGSYNPNSEAHFRAVLRKAGVWYDLNDLVVFDRPLALLEARTINNQGRIIAYGWAQGQDAYHRFLLIPMSVDSLALSASILAQNQTATATLSLNVPAPTKLDLKLTSSNPALVLPDKVTVLKGKKTATFTFTAKTVTGRTDGVITATYRTLKKSVSVSVRPLVTLSGKVGLQGCLNSAQSLTFDFRWADNTPAFTRPVKLNSDGSFQLTNVPAAAYKLAVKGSKWLRRVTYINTLNGPVTSLTIKLLPGDVVEDNAVNDTDLKTLQKAYGSKPGDANWNAQADLDCDGKVGANDLALLQKNLGKTGDH